MSERDPNERFWSKVDKSGDCWLWTGARCSDGYGSFFDGERVVGAHRYSLSMVLGPLGERHALHQCDNPPCVNPSHLYAGTQSDNSRDMVARKTSWQKKRTHCPKGHPYDESNTIVWGNGFRKCRECNRVSARERYRTKHNIPMESRRAV